MIDNERPKRPALSDLLGDAVTLATALWADRGQPLQDDSRHVLLLDLLHDATAMAQTLEEAARRSPDGDRVSVEPTDETHNLCPLCNTRVPAVKLEGLSRHEFFEHGDCGHFFANWTSAKLIRLGGDQLRGRLKAAVREQNARRLVPVLSNLL